MNKTDLVAIFGSQKAIGDLLGITRGAISLWPEKIPELRVYQLREKVPDLDARIAALPPRQAIEPAAESASAA